MKRNTHLFVVRNISKVQISLLSMEQGRRSYGKKTGWWFVGVRGSVDMSNGGKLGLNGLGIRPLLVQFVHIKAQVLALSAINLQ